jgi:CheY-like chemotaxis protein
MKVLVVDDEPNSLKLAHAVLASAGYEVGTADGALAALSLIQQDRPDLILLDLMLPEIDGVSLIRQIKSNPESESIHIIAITAYPDSYTKAAALEAGAIGYVLKPLNTRGILEMVEGLVNPESTP